MIFPAKPPSGQVCKFDHHLRVAIIEVTESTIKNLAPPKAQFSMATSLTGVMGPTYEICGMILDPRYYIQLVREHPSRNIDVGKTMSCLPPMTGNGKFIPPIYLW